MPHLSPISWMLTPTVFIFLLALFISSSWWHQAARFPKINISSKSSQTSKWNWN